LVAFAEDFIVGLATTTSSSASSSSSSSSDSSTFTAAFPRLVVGRLGAGAVFLTALTTFLAGVGECKTGVESRPLLEEELVPFVADAAAVIFSYSFSAHSLARCFCSSNESLGEDIASIGAARLARPLFFNTGDSGAAAGTLRFLITDDMLRNDIEGKVNLTKYPKVLTPELSLCFPFPNFSWFCEYFYNGYLPKVRTPNTKSLTLSAANNLTYFIDKATLFTSNTRK
jgi:hypothetical protein